MYHQLTTVTDPEWNVTYPDAGVHSFLMFWALGMGHQVFAIAKHWRCARCD